MMGAAFVHPYMDLEDETIEQFLSKIASSNISPAGGSAAAVIGAMGTSLCEMTCIHTLNSNIVEGDISEIISVREDLRANRETLLQLAEQDAQVIETAFSGSGTGVNQTEMKQSLGVPLSIAETSLDVLEVGARILEWHDRPVISDAKTGLILTNGSLSASIFIINSNLDLLTNQSFIEQIEKRVGAIVEAADNTAVELSEFLQTECRWR